MTLIKVRIWCICMVAQIQVLLDSETITNIHNYVKIY
jgi:hypothetical protein